MAGYVVSSRGIARLFLSFVMAGCASSKDPVMDLPDGQVDFVRDSSMTDAGIEPRDASTAPVDSGSVVADSSVPMDSGVADTGMVQGQPLSGRITFETRDISESGLSASHASPARRITVVLLSGDRETARTVTDEEGRYQFANAPANASIRVETSTDLFPLSVTDFNESRYAFRSASPDLYVTQELFAGAIALHQTMITGVEVATEAFARTERFLPLTTHWERGRTTPGGTSYVSGGDSMWILGGPNDTDEFDTPVLLHELGHYLQFVYDFSDWTSGNAHAQENTDPRLAWNEGWPTFFSSVVRNSPLYLDSINNAIAIRKDLGNLPTSRGYVGSPSAGMAQNHSEYIDSSAAWVLYQNDSSAMRLRRSFSPLTDWMDRPPSSRGHQYRDVVDFMDGYLCLYGESFEAPLRAHLTERMFPYDFAPPCSKPGHPPVFTTKEPAPVPLPGRVVMDEHGTELREILVP